MRLMVVSDIHGSLYYMKKILDIYNNDKFDKLILLGDLYYHGPRNPLTRDYNTMGVSVILNSLKDKILCVKGNCDAEVDEMISEFKFNEYITMNINNKRFFFTHGHKYNIDNIPKDVDVLMYGHFHIPFIKNKDNVLCINPGSISLPKNNTKNSYLIIDGDNITIKDIDGNIIDSIRF